MASIEILTHTAPLKKGLCFVSRVGRGITLGPKPDPGLVGERQVKTHEQPEGPCRKRRKLSQELKIPGRFLEHATVHGNLYGTSQASGLNVD